MTMNTCKCCGGLTARFGYCLPCWTRWGPNMQKAMEANARRVRNHRGHVLAAAREGRLGDEARLCSWTGEP